MRPSPLASRRARLLGPSLLACCVLGHGLLGGGALQAAQAAPPVAAAAPEAWAPAIAAARARAAELRAAKQVPGLAVAVAYREGLIWEEGFGNAGDGPPHPVLPSTRFRLASVSKLFAAAAAARLVEAGKLDLDRPIQAYVPSFPDKGRPITARLLAGHLAGIRHYDSKDFFPFKIDDQHFPTVTASLAIFKDDPLVAPPGEKYFYTTFGFTLLSAVVEGAAGSDYLSTLQRSVLDPLHLGSVRADVKGAEYGARSAFYRLGEDGKALPAPAIDPSYKWGGGGLLSTAGDLARFGAAHLEPGFFRPETLQLFFTSQRTADGQETGVGFGWRVGNEPGSGRRVAHHAGNIAGGRSVVVVYRDLGLVVALLSNLGGVPEDVEDQAYALAAPFLAVLDPPVRPTSP